MKKVKLLAALFTLVSPVVSTIPFSAETTVNNEETVVDETTVEVDETTVEVDETETTEDETDESVVEVESAPIVDAPTDVVGVLENVFPDEVVADAIARALNANLTDTVTEGELAGIQSLIVAAILDPTESYFVPAYELTGIQHLTGLESLRLVDTRVTDLSPIENLANLKVLEIKNFETFSVESMIEDYSPIANLVGLEKLAFGAQYGADLRFLTALTNLEVLGISDHAGTLSNTQVIGNLPSLTRLYAAGNGLDEDEVANMIAPNLVYADVSYNSIFDLSAFANVDAVNAREQFGYYIVNQFTKEELASTSSEAYVYTTNPITGIDGQALNLNTGLLGAGVEYDAAKSEIHFVTAIAENDERAFTFVSGDADLLPLPTGNVIPDSVEINDEKVEYRTNNGAEVYGANVAQAFSGTVIYKFKENRDTNDTDDSDSSTDGERLPETGINNYGTIAGSGSLALSALSMLVRKRIRK